jgi:lysophospholipase L1-like esterase
LLGSWTQTVYPGGSTTITTLGGNMLQCASGTTPLTFTPTNQVDTFEIYYATTGVGSTSMTAQIDALTGASQATLDLSPAASLQKATVTATLGTHTLNLARVSGTVFLIGIIAYNSAQKETTVINAGFSGSKIGDWVLNNGVFDPLDVIPFLAPDLVLLMLTSNDWVAGTNTTTYTANMQTMITACKSAGADVILFSGPASSTGSAAQATQDVYTAIVQGLATTNNLRFLSMTTQLYDWTTNNAAGREFDALHPNGTYYIMEGEAVHSTFVNVENTTLTAPDGLAGYFSMNASTLNFGTNILTQDIGGLSCPLVSLAAGASVAGQISGALAFDGVTDSYVTIGTDTYNAQAQGSLSAWVNMTAKPAAAGLYSIFGSGSSTVANGLFIFGLFGNSASDTRLRVQANQLVDTVMGNTNISAAAWHHVVATSDGAFLRLYVDGVLQTLTVSTGSNTGKWLASSVNGSMRYTIGNARRSSGDIAFFKGNIDDLRVYNRMLIPAEVTSLYNAGLASRA